MVLLPDIDQLLGGASEHDDPFGRSDETASLHQSLRLSVEKEDCLIKTKLFLDVSQSNLKTTYWFWDNCTPIKWDFKTFVIDNPLPQK